jgi:cytochrome c-type biogenesis protein CcmH
MRKQVKDLPIQFALDDSMAMSPQMKLSNFDEVVVVVRVSKTGNAMPQPGDLQGMSSPVKPGSGGLKVSIDTVVQ